MINKVTIETKKEALDLIRKSVAYYLDELEERKNLLKNGDDDDFIKLEKIYDILVNLTFYQKTEKIEDVLIDLTFKK